MITGLYRTLFIICQVDSGTKDQIKVFWTTSRNSITLSHPSSPALLSSPVATLGRTGGSTAVRVASKPLALGWTFSPERGLCTLHITLGDATLEVSGELLTPSITATSSRGILAVLRTGRTVVTTFVLHVVFPAILHCSLSSEGFPTLPWAASATVSVSFKSLALSRTLIISCSIHACLLAGRWWRRNPTLGEVGVLLTLTVCLASAVSFFASAWAFKTTF